MAKNNNGARQSKGPAQKYVDPLAFATSNKPAVPRTTWTLEPANEGNDHINIHSDSNHPLGRWFNPRATQPFAMGTLGNFNTIEAYMYFLLANSMSITAPDVVARVDALRQASSVMLGGATAHLPSDLRQAYAHTYRLPLDIYNNIIGYVADAYMAKIYELANAQGETDLLKTEIVRDILNNRMPYFGYYVSNGVTMNVSQRTTIISAIKVVTSRLLDMRAARKHEDQSPMKAALLRAGFAQPGTVNLGLKLNGEPTTEKALEEFRQTAEAEIGTRTYFTQTAAPMPPTWAEAGILDKPMDFSIGTDGIVTFNEVPKAVESIITVTGAEQAELTEETDSESQKAEADPATVGD